MCVCVCVYVFIDSKTLKKFTFSVSFRKLIFILK